MLFSSIVVMLIAFVGSLIGFIALLIWGWEPSHFLIAAIALAGLLFVSALWLRIFVDDIVRKEDER